MKRLSFDAHRVGAGSRSPPPSLRRPTTSAPLPSGDAVFSSPPSRRVRGDAMNIHSSHVTSSSSSGRYGVSAPAPPSLAVSPRVETTTTPTTSAAAAPPTQLRLRSKSATQRRTAVATPGAGHSGRDGAGGHSARAEPPRPNPRGRRGENVGDVSAVPTQEGAAQHMRARKVDGGAPSARRAATSAASPTPAIAVAPSTNSSAGLTNYQALQRVRMMVVAPTTTSASEAAVRGRNTSSSGNSPGHVSAAVHAREGEVTSPLTSPTVACTPPRGRTHISNSCPLPPMLNQARTPVSLSSCEASSSSNPSRSLCFVPLLRTPSATPERGAESPAMQHRVPPLIKFTPPSQPLLSSPVESFSPPTPPIVAHSQQHQNLRGAAPSNWSSSTLTDSAVTPHGGDCLTWTPSGSLSDDLSTQPSQQPQQQQHAFSQVMASAKEERRPRSLPSHGRFSTSEGRPLLTAERQFPPLLAPQSHTVVVPAQSVLPGSPSTPVSSSPAGSPTEMGGGAAAMRPPLARDAAVASAGTYPIHAPAALLLPPPQPILHKPTAVRRASPPVAAARDQHAAATASPNPLRPPRANAIASHLVSTSTDRRPLIGASAGSNTAAATAASTSTVRTGTKSPAGTLSTEAAKKAMKDRRRRELYAWNEQLRLKNEAGVQDAV
ncbi:hypothetical protein ABB37_08227 [Leptomonas pyrrhocoris]|uniref:Uncharacterized protein n=1 Tax=Leptomonas pyrrhocoris TaxID=157538 RepID=A0A0M9FTC0_LEPPY|nr:hypothetical protein ABB37_08227 [Leptomonas pyrrhocoris]XP_015654100.1 hypothetical protein ABB37_08227 [Leptomonas pyrrhocoris]XP_015654101.1 hypothetical protein ABB37_08227 [Leptomonas pyrrhocoris]KPA75660.1 hypothetical protein ABB37_08227 [Leptomonas pyrrhocoris]KPA75661.1 hypothetical protein ABB37_08227 [Leptomonas pyrrhocoris]KPA75662.1 hypothetical protein ABB37_08227 [Leptomonas pyrrhocoris]|eukprot:XP_015654099.1 hypothetical protein ABB37_08227 [Leptomonas pyrrhocoris]